MIFVCLLKFTDQGVRNIKETSQRAQAFREIAESKFGVRVKELFWTLGQYDLITIVDAPDEESFTAMALSLSSLGNVSTESLRAFTAEEMYGILSKV